MTKESGLKNGDAICCGDDLREFIGMNVVDVESDSNNSRIILWFENREECKGICFDDGCFDGKYMQIVDNSSFGEVKLRRITEHDLQEIAKMQHYCSIDITDEGTEEKIGIHMTYCNDIRLEGTDDFVIKGLCIFYDGRIMTEK